MISGAIVNALAYTGSQVPARITGGTGGSLIEVKRHIATLEQSQRAQA